MPPLVTPLVAAMLSIPTGERYAPPAHPPQRQKDLTIEALIAHLLGLARRGPLLVLVEDVHWADPTTLELIDHLVDRIPSERILLVITFRPEFAAPWSGRPHVASLVLGRLGPASTAELARSVARGRGIAGRAPWPDPREDRRRAALRRRADESRAGEGGGGAGKGGQRSSARRFRPPCTTA